jgi:hypothetical protein
MDGNRHTVEGSPSPVPVPDSTTIFLKAQLVMLSNKTKKEGEKFGNIYVIV